MDDRVKTVRALLDKLSRSRRHDNDYQEQVAEEVAVELQRLPSPGIVSVVDKAIGRSKARRSEAVFILAEFADVPEVNVRIGEWLRDGDPQWRSCLVQAVEQRRLYGFCDALAAMLESETDALCRSDILHAIGALRCEVALPALIFTAKRDRPSSAVMWALRNFEGSEVHALFRQWFYDPAISKPLRVLAAWGLAKFGEEPAVAYLIEMLDDTSNVTPTGSDPGQGFRAAQALADLNGWEFSSTRAGLNEVKQRLAASRNNAG